MKNNNSTDWFTVHSESRTMQIIRWVVAIIIAVLLNLAYVRGIPTTQATLADDNGDAEEETTFDLQLVEDDDEWQYVEANPDAPENEPDDTANISNRNQQAAQEEVASQEDSPMPFLEGEEEDSRKIVQGEIPVEEQQTTPSVAVQGSQPTEAQEAQQAQESSPTEQSIDAPFSENLPAIPPPPPTPDFIEEIQSDDEEGIDLKIIENETEVSTPNSEFDDDQPLNINIPPSVAEMLSKRAQNQEQQSVQDAAAANPQPLPRKRLSPDVLPGPLMFSRNYAAIMGPLAMDSKFTQFGYYLRRMFDAIQLQWYSLLEDITISQKDRPAFVDVEYVINSQGIVTRATVVNTDASELSVLLCKDSIESRSPYGPWTEQMIEELGDETTITVRFRYL